MAKTAVSQLEDQIELIRREAFAAGYAAAMQAIREVASHPAPGEKPSAPKPPGRRGRTPRQPRARRMRVKHGLPASPQPNALNAGRMRSSSRMYSERSGRRRSVRVRSVPLYSATRVSRWPTPRSAMRLDNWQAEKW